MGIGSAKARNSAFELVKIVSILLIICFHYVTKTKAVGLMSPNTPNFFFINLFQLGNLGVVLFVMCSGFFLCNSKKVDFLKLFLIVFEVIFYSIVLYVFSELYVGNKITLIGCLKSVLTLFNNDYWFITAYVVLYLLHPFINVGLNKISTKNFAALCLICFILWSVVRTFTSMSFGGNGLTNVFVSYIFGAFIYRIKTLNIVRQSLD